MKVAFYTLGCKVNQYETEVLKGLFEQNGYTVVQNGEAGVYVVNSCTVTGTGDKKTLQLLRRLRRDHPQAVIALTGCFAQAQSPEILPQEADVVTGTRARGALVALVGQALVTGERIVQIAPHTKDEPFEEMHAGRFSDKTRAFIKIQDGCDRYCSYCIIPRARGFLRSKPLDALAQEVQTLAQNGYREVVLVGINLSKYGFGENADLAQAVDIACRQRGIERVRLGSLEPDLIGEEMVRALSRQPKLCPQFHLSLQSGCDQTLRRMNRHYTCVEYEHIALLFRRYFPGCALTTDIMVGFPGETEEEFAASLCFAQKMRFAKAHVFAYSPRPDTVAARMPQQIAQAEKRRRSERMIEAMDCCRQGWMRAKVGSNQLVLFETARGALYEGYTADYTPCTVRSEVDLRGNLASVRITGVSNGACEGEPAP